MGVSGNEKLFQSTPSVGRATLKAMGIEDEKIDISIHALRGEGDEMIAVPMPRELYISIHALRGEGDVGFCPACKSTVISIHALRGEGDLCLYDRRTQILYFNPRPPWGGRPSYRSSAAPSDRHFNPRPPWGGRHLPTAEELPEDDISIHALRGEGDP